MSHRNYLHLPETYIPKSYKGRVHWYVSQYIQSMPIHLFSSKQSAYDWARTQPALIVGGVEMVPSFDWFPANSNPRETISNTREFVDHRKPVNEQLASNE